MRSMVAFALQHLPHGITSEASNPCYVRISSPNRVYTSEGSYKNKKTCAAISYKSNCSVILFIDPIFSFRISG